ncbi:MAG: hypothetical protein ABSD44_16220 [Terracidiphilus sp.]
MKGERIRRVTHLSRSLRAVLFNRIHAWIPVGPMKIEHCSKAHRFCLLPAGYGIACAFWFCGSAFAQRSVSPPAALSLEEKVGQMLQVRVFADDPNLQGEGFQRELQDVTSCHAGSIGLKIYLKGPNLQRLKQDVVSQTLNGLQAGSAVPLLVGGTRKKSHSALPFLHRITARWQTI